MLAYKRHEVEVMLNAFELVDPQKTFLFFHGDDLYRSFGKHAPTWKDEIVACVPDSRLKAAGVTIEDVVASIEFYTATKARVSREVFGVLGTRDFRGESGYLVRADGYRKGPAGG